MQKQAPVAGSSDRFGYATRVENGFWQAVCLNVCEALDNGLKLDQLRASHASYEKMGLRRAPLV